MSAADSYRVAATLAFKSNAAETLVPIIEGLERVDRAVARARENLAGFADSMRSLNGLSRSISSIGRAMQQLGSEKMGGGLAQVERMSTAMNGMARQQEAMAASARVMAEGYAATTRAMSAAGRLRAPGAAAGRGGAGSQSHLSSMDVAIAADTAAVGMKDVVERMAHASFEPAYYQNLLQADARVSPQQAQQAYDAAFAATRSAPGSTIGKNMEAIYDVTNVLGNVQEGIAAIPAFAKLTSVFRASSLHEGGNDDPALAASKALEVMGRLTEEKVGSDGKMHREMSQDALLRYTDAIARVAVRTGGRVDADAFLSYSKQARVGGMQQDDRFTFSQLPAIMQVLGGSRTGTFVNSMNSVFSGGHMMDKTMSAFIAAGLADKGGISTVKGADGKEKTVVNAEAIHDFKLMSTNLVEWIRKQTTDLESRGKSRDEILRILQTLGQRTTIGGGWADVYANMPGIDREEAGIRNTLKPGADGKDPFIGFLNSNPQARVQQFQAALENLLAVFGKDTLPQGIALMGKMTDAMNALGDWAKKNPGEAKLIADVAVSLGALAVAIGVVSTGLLIYGPIIKAMGAGSLVGRAGKGIAGLAEAGAVAAATGLKSAATAVAGEAGAAAVGLAAKAIRVASPVGAFLSAMAPTATASDDTMAGYRARHPSAVPPPASSGTGSSGPIPVHVVNGKDLARGVTAVQARSASGPSTGATGFDGRTSPLQPGAGGL